MDNSPSEPVEKKPLIATDGTVLTSVEKPIKPSAIQKSVLPIVYDILSCFEKEPTDNTEKQRLGAECNQKILELHNHFQTSRAQINKLAGIDLNKDEQLQQLERLKHKLENYQKIISTYKDMKF